MKEIKALEKAFFPFPLTRPSPSFLRYRGQQVVARPSCWPPSFRDIVWKTLIEKGDEG